MTMKAPLVAGKFAAMAFASLVLVACTSSDTQEDAAAAEAAAAEAAAAEAAAAEAQAARAAEERARAEAMAEQERLEDKAKGMGYVVYFAFDSSALTDEGRAVLDAHIAALRGNDHKIRLEGHTDERGTREYNLALGERRANAVRDYMVANGVPTYRMETISYGEENPIAFGSGESNWSQNRRVELKH
jgi:peptidoglycan-associated lipoprotein